MRFDAMSRFGIKWLLGSLCQQQQIKLRSVELRDLSRMIGTKLER